MQFCDTEQPHQPPHPLLAPAHLETLRGHVAPPIRDAEVNPPHLRGPLSSPAEDRSRGHSGGGGRAQRGKQGGKAGGVRKTRIAPEGLRPFYPSKRPHENQGLESGGEAAERSQQAPIYCLSLPRAVGPSPVWPPSSSGFLVSVTNFSSVFIQ